MRTFPASLPIIFLIVMATAGLGTTGRVKRSGTNGTSRWSRHLCVLVVLLKTRKGAAIPNYARNNRNKIEFTYAPGPENRDGGSKVWIRKSK